MNLLGSCKRYGQAYFMMNRSLCAGLIRTSLGMRVGYDGYMTVMVIFFKFINYISLPVVGKLSIYLQYFLGFRRARHITAFYNHLPAVFHDGFALPERQGGGLMQGLR